MARHREIPLKIAKKKLRRIHSVEKELSGGFESVLPSPIACIRYAPPRPDAANLDVLDAIPSTNAIVFGYAPLHLSLSLSLPTPSLSHTHSVSHIILSYIFHQEIKKVSSSSSAISMIAPRVQVPGF
jgi:hypothetical protein